MKRQGPGWIAILAAAWILWAGTEPAVANDIKVTSTKPQKLGNGWARVYVAVDAKGDPLALGVSMDEAALEGLPAEPDPSSRCFDRNGNGELDKDECLGDHELVFMLPQEQAASALAQFKWVGLNWNPHGHSPPAPPPWAVPHFDFHFYTATREAVKAIRPGACGELIDCDDFQKAIKPVPARYVHRDYISVDAAVPDMGNHLVNSKAPELAEGGPPFTHTFIFGAYDGQITFLEPMITHAYLVSRPDMCALIKQPKAFAVAGFHPTKYCIRHLARAGRYTVSLEGFERRDGG